MGQLSGRKFWGLHVLGKMQNLVGDLQWCRVQCRIYFLLTCTFKKHWGDLGFQVCEVWVEGRNVQPLLSIWARESRRLSFIFMESFNASGDFWWIINCAMKHQCLIAIGANQLMVKLICVPVSINYSNGSSLEGWFNYDILRELKLYESSVFQVALSYRTIFCWRKLSLL